MDININYGGGKPPQNVNTDAGVEKQPRSERAARAEKSAEKLNGESLQGQIVEASRGETPLKLTVKLPDGRLLKGLVEPPVPADIKPGDTVMFDVAAAEGRAVFQGLSRVEQRTEADARLAVMKSALEMAGLKPTEENLKLVSVLLENELPISRESIQSLSRLTKMAGAESAEKAVLLMKNDIQPTRGSLERLEGFLGGGGKLLSQIEELAKSIMEMDNGAEKRRLIQILTGTLSEAGEKGAEAVKQTLQGENVYTGKNTVSGEAQSPAALKAAPAGHTTQPGQPERTGQAANSAAAQGPLPEPSENLGQTPRPVFMPEAETGTRFFREAFADKQAVQAHLRQHPLPADTERFISEHAKELTGALAELGEKGELTKENVIKLLKTVIGSEGGGIPFAENDAELKSFMFKLAEKGGLLDDFVERSERMRGAVLKGARRIVEGLSVSLDGKDTEESLSKAFENIKERLALAVKELGPDESKVKQNVEDIKENLKFLSNLKNNTLVEFPLFVAGEQRYADLYVFSRKGGKKNSAHSQSALLSLEMANLGRFETYIQKTGRSVICQFRPDNEEAGKLALENIDKLSAALKNKNYSLDGVSYKKTDESFSLIADEPETGEGEDDSRARGVNYSIDYRM